MIDFVAVPGRTGGTLVFELLGRKGTLADPILRARDAYQDGLQCLLHQRFGEAIAHFHSAHELQPQDVAAAVMLARASALIEIPSLPHEPGPYFGNPEPGPAMTRQTALGE